MIFSEVLMRPRTWQSPTGVIFRSAKRLIFHCVKKFLGELTVSTMATLIVTAALSNFLFVAPNRPEPSTPRRPVGDLVFWPLPVAPVANFSRESASPEPAGKVPLKEKPAREQAPPHKTIRGTAKPGDVAPIQTTIDPPLQLIGASFPPSAVANKPPASTGASGYVQSAAAFLRPLQALAGHISWLVPKL
jgi:hypothetical protein